MLNFPKIHYSTIFGRKKGQKKLYLIFSNVDPKYVCMQKNKFLGLKIKKLLFNGYTLLLKLGFIVV